MTLLSPPNILPNAMYLVCKALSSRGAFDGDRLKALVQPPTLKLRQEGGNSYDLAVKALVELGLVVKQDRSLRLAAGVPTASVREFYGRLLVAVVAAETSTSKDLLRMLSWFAAQDPYGRPFDWGRAERQMLGEYKDAESRPVTNSNPYASFERWAVALGFAERDADGLIPDATRALRSVLPALTSSRGPVLLRDVLIQVRDVLPVLDGGHLARVERDVLLDEAERRADQGAVDVYLTHALLRCEEDGDLRLSSLSDADQVLLSDGGSLTARSHVELQVGAAS